MTLSMLVGGTLALAVLVALVAGTVWLVRGLTGGRTPHGGALTGPGGSPTPVELLEQRYAAGEIDDVELYQRRANLSH